MGDEWGERVTGGPDVHSMPMGTEGMTAKFITQTFSVFYGTDSIVSKKSQIPAAFWYYMCVMFLVYTQFISKKQWLPIVFDLN